MISLSEYFILNFYSWLESLMKINQHSFFFCDVTNPPCFLQLSIHENILKCTPYDENDKARASRALWKRHLRINESYISD